MFSSRSNTHKCFLVDLLIATLLQQFFLLQLTLYRIASWNTSTVSLLSKRLYVLSQLQKMTTELLCFIGIWRGWNELYIKKLSMGRKALCLWIFFRDGKSKSNFNTGLYMVFKIRNSISAVNGRHLSVARYNKISAIFFSSVIGEVLVFPMNPYPGYIYFLFRFFFWAYTLAEDDLDVFRMQLARSRDG